MGSGVMWAPHHWINISRRYNGINSTTKNNIINMACKLPVQEQSVWS